MSQSIYLWKYNDICVFCPQMNQFNKRKWVGELTSLLVSTYSIPLYCLVNRYSCYVLLQSLNQVVQSTSHNQTNTHISNGSAGKWGMQGNIIVLIGHFRPDSMKMKQFSKIKGSIHGKIIFRTEASWVEGNKGINHSLDWVLLAKMPNVLPASIIQKSDSDFLHLIHILQQIDIYWHNGNGNFQEKL